MGLWPGALAGREDQPRNQPECTGPQEGAVASVCGAGLVPSLTREACCVGQTSPQARRVLWRENERRRHSDSGTQDGKDETGSRRALSIPVRPGWLALRITQPPLFSFPMARISAVSRSGCDRQLINNVFSQTALASSPEHAPPLAVSRCLSRTAPTPPPRPISAQARPSFRLLSPTLSFAAIGQSPIRARQLISLLPRQSWPFCCPRPQLLLTHPLRAHS